MSDDRKDLPPVTSPNFLEKVREAVQTYLGNRGSVLDRGLTVRDLADAGLIDVAAGYLSGRGNPRPVAGPGSALEPVYETDLTPPPMPSGFAATAAISNLLVECDPPTYTQGHGHAKSRLYGATWDSGELPVFADAVVITEFSGTVASHATNPATTWHLWLTWVTVDGVESTSPAGGTNGVVTRTGEDVSLLVEAMTGPGNPFTVLKEDTVVDGVTFPAGTYSTRAFIQDAQITNAKIANLAVDDAKIDNLSATKLTIGDGTVGGDLKSTTFSTTPGSESGWKIQPDGTATFNTAVVRGTVYANAGQIGGITIAENAVRAGQTAYNAGQGFYLGSDGTFSLGNSAGNQLTWDGANLNVVGGGTFSGDISAATGTFGGNVHGGQFTTGAYTGYAWPAAGSYGTYLGPSGLLIGNANNGKYVQITQTGDIYTPGFNVVNGTMTVNQANVINTLNIAGNAVTAVNSANGTGVVVSTTVNVPAGITGKVIGLAILGEGASSMTLTIHGVSTTISVAGIIQSDGNSHWYSYPPFTVSNIVSVTGPATVVISANAGNNGVLDTTHGPLKTVIAICTFR